MSDQGLHELGLPRRAFLKRAAIVFVPPAVLSLSLGGTAEAGTPGCAPGQGFPNQAETAGDLVVEIFNREHQGYVLPSVASNLRGKLLRAERLMLEGNRQATCETLADVQRSLNAQGSVKIEPGFASYLQGRVNGMFSQLNCSACVRQPL